MSCLALELYQRFNPKEPLEYCKSMTISGRGKWDVWAFRCMRLFGLSIEYMRLVELRLRIWEKILCQEIYRKRQYKRHEGVLCVIYLLVLPPHCCKMSTPDVEKGMSDAGDRFERAAIDASGSRQTAVQGPGHRRFGNPGPLWAFFYWIIHICDASLNNVFVS